MFKHYLIYKQKVVYIVHITKSHDPLYTSDIFSNLIVTVTEKSGYS